MTEQELLEAISGHVSFGNMQPVMDAAKAYADAKVEAKDKEIARLNAELKRLRDGVKTIGSAISPMHQDDVYIVRSRIDVIFKTVQSLLSPADAVGDVSPLNEDQHE